MELTDQVVNALYTEAMVLADEARSYFDSVGRTDRATMSPLNRVTFSCESLKVTTRLMHIVAWLLARRAQLAGQATAAHPLSAASPSDFQSLQGLPADARQIVVASIDLYARIERLHVRLAETPEVANPAIALRQRLERAF